MIWICVSVSCISVFCVSVENLNDISERKKQEEKQKREQALQEQHYRKQLRDIEQTQQNLKSEYFQRKIQLALSFIEGEPNLHSEILERLRQDYDNESRSIFVELALNSYKTQADISSIEEFIDNFMIGGMFQAYVLENISVKFKEFQNLKDEYIPRANEVGLKENDFF